MIKLKGSHGYKKLLSTGKSEGSIQMAKWKLKSCPRCAGDMFSDTDLHGLFEQCLQCGYSSYSRHTVTPDESDNPEKEEEKVGSTSGKKW